MRTTSTHEARPTFTQRKRRDQLVDCAIDAIAELGFNRASVGEVARRAGVSKGVVTYHFPAKDDLINEAVAHIFGSVRAFLESRLGATSPDRFVADYVMAWVAYYRTHPRYMLAIREIWTNFRDDGGQLRFGGRAVADELATVEHVLELGQADGSRGTFSARVMALTMKAALDALLAQLAEDPDLDLEAYGLELVGLFERATRPDAGAGAPDVVEVGTRRRPSPESESEKRRT